MLQTARVLTRLVASNVRRDPAGLVVKVARVAYVGTAGILLSASYTGYRNQGSKRGFLSTLASGKWKPEDADRPLSEDGTSPTAEGANGDGGAQSEGNFGKTGSEPFNQRRYNERMENFRRAAASFGLQLTSAGRTEAENRRVNGSATSFHLFSRGALGFDAGDGPGPISPNERRFYDWCRSRSDVFQEVLLHDAGSGYHVHAAFRPGVTGIGPGVAAVPDTDRRVRR